MKIKTSELAGAALDWAVATSDGRTIGSKYTPSTNWGQGGSIVEREKITVGPYHRGKDGQWQAYIGWDRDAFDVAFKADGETPLIAAMRCYVVSKLGDEVEIPRLTKGD